MLTPKDFVTMSLDLNLFFLRTMKEHSLFLQLGFTPVDSAMAHDAAAFRMGFERLLSEAVKLANDHVGQSTLESHKHATQYTASAERLTTFYTGVPIDTGITEQEEKLSAATAMPDTKTVNAVEDLDKRAYQLTKSLAEFKQQLLNNVRSCKTFTMNYPLLIDHILREARLFMNSLVALVRGQELIPAGDLIQQEIFWNRIMAEHAKFINGLLDPSEVKLIDTARTFGREFDALTEEAIQASNQNRNITKVTQESLQETIKIRDFKTAATKGLIECQIQSIILPLLSDHVLREANHYLSVLQSHL